VRAEDYAFVLLSRFINSLEQKVSGHPWAVGSNSSLLHLA
jgi:hypothetical protein